MPIYLYGNIYTVGRTVFPQNSCVEVLNTLSKNVTVFGDKVLKEMIRLK